MIAACVLAFWFGGVVANVVGIVISMRILPTGRALVFALAWPVTFVYIAAMTRRQVTSGIAAAAEESRIAAEQDEER